MKFDFKNSHFATIVMILSFMYGGISLFFFVSQMAALGAAHDLPPQIIVRGQDINSSPFYMQNNETNSSDSRVFGIFRAPNQIDKHAREFAYGLIGISLLGSIISILAGISMLILIRKHERKSITKNMIDTLTTPEEKISLEELERKGGELTQSELVKNTGLSKVKIHRVVKRLEELGILNKYPYGMTNKLKLNLNKDILKQ